MSTIFILLIIIAIIVFLVVVLYNRIIGLRNTREKSFADIDVQLKQRHDLIPQLVEAVKAYMGHENSTLIELTKARSEAVNAQSIDEKIAAENKVENTLRKIKVSVEAYPDLKASTNFLQLQNEIADIENKLAASRRYFNSTTREYNTAIEVFPANLIAGMFGFRREVMYDLGTNQREQLEERPKLDFN